ncbi:MAG: methyl-accepting chemotaxis protein, partial [Melioribacteraceae bacterium]
VSLKANETKSFADSGKQSIDEMSETIRNLVGVTESVSKKLSLINKNADNISNIISTITKVADQTNLLSLNAAIEAEKAGKYGKGFSVVAKEIRRLADQTAVATLDIEKMIKEMQSSVKSGVEEMDKFFVEVRLSVSAIEVIKQQLEKIIKNVHEISPRFIAVNDGMMNQAQGADQINEAIMQLSASAEETAAAIKGFNKVAEELNEAVKNLENEIEQFHADEN